MTKQNYYIQIIMKVKVKNTTDFELPKYETENSYGMDVRANTQTTIPPNSWKLILTGLFVEIPSGEEIQVRPRSGLALKHGVTVLNSPGTIDADFRGEIGVILINHGQEDYKVEIGDRVAQLVGSKRIEWEEVSALSETQRGKGGFGSTGIK